MDKTYFEIGPEEQRLELTVIADNEVQVSFDADWITRPDTNPFKTGTLVLDVSAMPRGTSRTAVVTLRAGSREEQITVSQTDSDWIPVSGISLDVTSINLSAGESYQLTATVSPDNATDKTVTWSSSDTNVATVSNGIVQAVAEGTSTITVNAGGKSATCIVTVKSQIVPVASVSLDKASLTLDKGQSEVLTATVNPSNATDKTVSWSSSDETIASVDQNGQVTALAGGSATITAKAGEMSATCTVTITVPVESISLDHSSVTLIEGQTITLVATVNPDDAKDKTVTWNSSDSSVASVDQQGRVTAITKGSTTIMAMAGNKQGTCAIVVQQKVSGGNEGTGREIWD